MALFYEDVLAALANAEVEFVLVGGIAVILQGVPRTTADLDLAVALTKENLGKLVATMTTLGFRPRAPVPAADLVDPERRREWIEEKGMVAFTFQRPSRPLDEVDVLIQPRIPFAELCARADRFGAEGLTLAVASVPDLIALKDGTGRANDEADIDALRRILAARDP